MKIILPDIAVELRFSIKDRELEAGRPAKIGNVLPIEIGRMSSPCRAGPRCDTEQDVASRSISTAIGRLADFVVAEQKLAMENFDEGKIWNCMPVRSMTQIGIWAGTW